LGYSLARGPIFFDGVLLRRLFFHLEVIEDICIQRGEARESAPRSGSIVRRSRVSCALEGGGIVYDAFGPVSRKASSRSFRALPITRPKRWRSLSMRPTGYVRFKYL
jgi:hypothetical protein